MDAEGLHIWEIECLPKELILKNEEKSINYKVHFASS